MIYFFLVWKNEIYIVRTKLQFFLQHEKGFSVWQYAWKTNQRDSTTFIRRNLHESIREEASIQSSLLDVLFRKNNCLKNLEHSHLDLAETVIWKLPLGLEHLQHKQDIAFNFNAEMSINICS